MSNPDNLSSKKRKRDEEDEEDDLLAFGQREAPPPALQLPGGYSDESNPFNDSQLSAPFKWKLKQQKQAKIGLSTGDDEGEMLQREETLKEIEQLKQRRLEREHEQAQWEVEQARLAREKEQLMAAGWEKDEDRFLLSQLKMLALKRLQELRPHSIDLLFLIYAAYVRLWYKEAKLEPEKPKTSAEQQLQQMEAGLVLPKNLPSPESIVNDITQLEDIKSLTDDIQLFYAVESDTKSPANIRFEELKAHHAKNPKSKSATIASSSSYWSALQVLVDEREVQIISSYDGKPSTELEQEQRVAQAVQTTILPEILESIDDMLREQTIEQLRETETDVEAALSSDGPKDEEYWRAMIKRIKWWKAKFHVNNVYQLVLDDIKANPTLHSQSLPDNARIVASSSIPKPSASAVSDKDVDDEGFEEVDEGEPDHGAPLAPPTGVWVDTSSSASLDNAPLDEDAMLKLERSKGLGKGEEAFGDSDVNVGEPESDMRNEIRKALYGFHYNDKLRPRKPKYFNRVKTGFEWTKYNQLHYDFDNPPPKVVQGYKFTIFYPDLIDPTKPPGYSIEKSDSPDFVILRFRAGPPYLDIAFRIVNKEWSVAPKHGYKCMFARGVLYLWFNFKRLRYRR